MSSGASRQCRSEVPLWSLVSKPGEPDEKNYCSSFRGRRLHLLIGYPYRHVSLNKLPTLTTSR
jgi:hypothetical protein